MGDNMVTIIVAVLGSGAFSALVNMVCRMLEEKSGQNEAMRLLLKDRLRFLCVHYVHQGWIYEDELEDLIRMHDCYHNKLHGNGYLDTLMAKVKALEVRGIGV